MIYPKYICRRDGRYRIFSTVPIPMLVSEFESQRYRYRCWYRSLSLGGTDTDAGIGVWDPAVPVPILGIRARVSVNGTDTNRYQDFLAIYDYHATFRNRNGINFWYRSIVSDVFQPLAVVLSSIMEVGNGKTSIGEYRCFYTVGADTGTGVGI